MAIIERKSLAAEVAAQMQEQILKGTYAINQKLPIEQKLMEYFGVGRSTVREAVKILENSGYIRVQQGLGTFVEDNSGVHETMSQRIKRSSTEDIKEVRHLLEMKIAEKAAMNRSANDISKMEHYLEKRNRAAHANQAADYVDSHVLFYQVMAEACKNTILTDMFKSFVKRLREDMLAEHVGSISINPPGDLHHKLLESIIRQDPSRAWYWSGKITGQITQ